MRVSRHYGRVVLGLVLVLGGLEPSGVAVASAPHVQREPGENAAWPAAVPQLAVPDCPKGESPIMPVTARQIPYNGVAYVYSLNGHEVLDLVPPADFNPVRASDEELATFNWAPRPTDTESLSDWTKNATQYTGTATPLWCTLTDQPGNVATIRRSAAPTTQIGALPLTHEGTLSFAGYRNTSGGYQRLGGHFNQSTSIGGGGDMLTWFGLNASGGYSELLQAGTHNAGGNSAASGFWEIYCNPNPGSYCNAIQDRNPVLPSSDVSVSVSYNPATDVGYFQVASQGTLVVNAQANLHPGVNSGAEADYYIEKLTSTLIPFAPMQWSALKTYHSWNSGPLVYFGDQPFTGVVMTDNGTFYSPPCSNSAHILAWPGQDTETGFVMTHC